MTVVGYGIAFNGSVISMLTQGAVQYRFNARLSLNFTGGYFLTRRLSTGLYGNTGQTAGVDAQYRLSRRTTIGATYGFTNFNFTGTYGDTQLNTLGGTYSYAFNRNTEFSSRLGVGRLESTSLGVIQLDPTLAAILGQTSVLQALYKVSYVPDVTVQLRRKVSDLSLSLAYNRGITPGNGLILTSTRQTASAGANYVARRVWNLAASAGYDSLKGTTTNQSYQSTVYNVSVYRKIAWHLDWHFRMDYRRYNFTDTAYLRNGFLISSGIVWSPGDILNRVW